MKRRKLLSLERERLIAESLGENGRTIIELSKILRVSEATVRRDLQSMEEQGIVRRVHGGAMPSKFPGKEPIFDEKASLQAEEKGNIAKLALSLIDDKDSIYLDGGSTVLGLARILGSKKKLTILTNSLMAASELVDTEHRLILVGGEVRAISRTMVGPLTTPVIKSLHVNKAFMGTLGFTVEEGISTTDPNEAYTKEIIIKRANKVIIMADSSKLGLTSFVNSGLISDIDVIITDKGISEKMKKSLMKKKVEIIY